MKQFLIIAIDDSTKRLLNSWINPGPKNKKLPEELKPLRIRTGVYTMSYTYDSARQLIHVISNRKKNVQVYIVEDPLRLMELILSIDSLPKMGRDAESGIPA